MRRRHAPGRRVAAGRAPAVGEPVFPSAAARRPSTTKLRQRRRSDARRRAPRRQIAARASQQPPHRAAHAAQQRHGRIPDTPCGRCHCRRALQQRFMFARLLPPASAQGLMPSRRPLAWAPQPYIEPPARLVRPFFHPQPRPQHHHHSSALSPHPSPGLAPSPVRNTRAVAGLLHVPAVPPSLPTFTHPILPPRRAGLDCPHVLSCA